LAIVNSAAINMGVHLRHPSGERQGESWIDRRFRLEIYQQIFGNESHGANEVIARAKEE
jgi:hypothetical protein